jgi:hypothetical protein
MDLEGKILPGSNAPVLAEDKLRKMYQTMVRVQCLDDVFYNAQVGRGAYLYYSSSSTSSTSTAATTNMNMTSTSTSVNTGRVLSYILI